MTSALGQKNMIPRTTLWVEYFPILIGKEIEVQRASLSDSKTCNWLRAELSFEISMFPKVTHLHHLLLGLGLFLCRVSSLLILQSASSSKNLQLCGAGFSTALHLYCMHSKCHPFIWPKLSSHKSWSPNSYLTLTSHHSSLLCPSTFCFCLPWFVHLFLAWVCAHLRLTHCDIWIVARQAPLSMGSSRRECWSGLSFSSSVDLLDPGIKPTYPALAGRFFFTNEQPGKPHSSLIPPSKPLSFPSAHLCFFLLQSIPVQISPSLFPGLSDNYLRVFLIKWIIGMTLEKSPLYLVFICQILKVLH